MSYQQFPPPPPPPGYYPPPGYLQPYPPPPFAQPYPLNPPIEGNLPPPQGYQAYFYDGYPPLPQPPCQPCYHRHNSASCYSFLQGCLAALCCCCVLEDCCF